MQRSNQPRHELGGLKSFPVLSLSQLSFMSDYMLNSCPRAIDGKLSEAVDLA